MVREESTTSIPDEIYFKACLLGDEAVGKTSFCHALCLSESTDDYCATVGLDVYYINIPIGIYKKAIYNRFIECKSRDI